jgi:hypothetical protein
LSPGVRYPGTDYDSSRKGPFTIRMVGVVYIGSMRHGCASTPILSVVAQ